LMDAKKLVEGTEDEMVEALEMPGVMEWAAFVDGWMRANPADAVEMGKELASVRMVFDEIVERILVGYGVRLPPLEPPGLLNGFCSSYSERFEPLDVSKEVGVATMERFTQAVRRGMDPSVG